MLHQGDEFFIKAFNHLSTERPIGYSIGPIPHSKILAYAERVGLDEDFVDDFVYIIREMDEGYLEWQREQDEPARKQKSK